MSARAASRLEGFGFRQIYRYVAGKMDWLAYGLPFEGEEAAAPHLGDLAVPDVPVCAPGEEVAAVRARASDWGVCVVINDERVVLGMLRRDALEASGGATAEQVMERAPSTYRPDVRPRNVIPQMRQHGIDTTLVTDPAGRLIGAVRFADAQQAASRRRT